jgi:hypothetical protein
MAQPREQVRANQSAQSAASNGRAQSGATPGERPSLLGVLGRVLSLRTAPTDTKRGRWSNFSKMLFVLLIFMFVIQLVYFLLALLDTHAPSLQLKLPLVPDRTFPLLGVMPRREVLFWVIAIVGYILLYRFNIIPRDPMGVKARADARAKEAQAAHAARPATRAGRRKASRLRDTSASGTRAPSPSPAAAVRAETVPQGPHDAEYLRAKAAQRLRRRRDAKR